MWLCSCIEAFCGFLRIAANFLFTDLCRVFQIVFAGLGVIQVVTSKVME